MKSDNVSVHRTAANKLNNETRATRGSVCNALLSNLVAPVQLFNSRGFFTIQLNHVVRDTNRRHDPRNTVGFLFDMPDYNTPG